MVEKYPEATVGALIFNKKGEIFMLKTHKWSDKYALPGGHIDFGETMVEAVKREVKEETNLDIYDIKFFRPVDCISPDDYHREKKHFIFLDFTARTNSEDVKLNEEAEDYIWVKPKDAIELPVEPFTLSLIKEYLKGIQPIS